MTTEADAVEYTRQHWAESGQPAAEHFAAMGALMRTHQLMVNEMDRLLKPHNLSRTAFLLMATLLMSREHTRPLGQLSRHLMVHPTTVTLVIDQLAGRDLVTRRPHPTDRRTVLATLTDEGRRVVAKASDDLGAAQFGLSGVNESLAQRLTGVLGQVRTKMGDVD
ncbi:MAG TPA: MarR family transcriptional regulator [Pseudonocardia sp.]|jgi:DNA-binding MarR family transcriptional regulator|nr:MarR family transcriptional regulator [Pseudonocardia sp.]